MSDNNYTDAIEEEYFGELEPIDIDQPCPVVENDEAVITTLARLNTRDKEIAKLEKQRDFMKKEIDDWVNNQVAKIESQKQWFLTPLKSFMESINKSNPKIKSLKFPTGKIGLRQSPQKIEILEGYKFGAEDDFAVKVVSYSVSKKEIMKHYKKTEKLPKYASVISGEVKFYYTGGE